MSITVDDVRAVVVEALDVVVLPRFDDIETHLDKHDERFDRLESRVGGVEAEIASFKVEHSRNSTL